MSEAGDRGFLFRTSGLALLILAVWQLGEAGGVLAAKGQLLANREAMVKLAPLFLLGLFSTRTASYEAKCGTGRWFSISESWIFSGGSNLRVGSSTSRGGVSSRRTGESVGETSWALRDRLQDVEGKMAQLDRDSAQGGELSEGAADSRRRDVENKNRKDCARWKSCG